MADAFAANLTAVDQLAADLSQILSDIRSLNSLFDGYDGSLGSRRVEDALNRFHDDSSEARRKVEGLVERVSGMLSSVSSGARQVDSDLRGSFDQPAPAQATPGSGS